MATPGRIGTLSAMSSLAQNINTTESAQRELGVLDVLNQNLQKDKAQNLVMQELEANEYAEISNFASQLLDRDRNAVNEKSLSLQADIKKQIAAFGSRKKFFESGGLSMLKKYKTDLLSSPEVSRMRENKTNMERIMQLQVAGKGHLLAPSDLRNLQLYQSGQTDTITYSGMMSEIDYPAEFYAFGSEIPDINVLHYKDNFVRIYGNYVTEYGAKALDGLDDQGVQTELLAFMNKMNYKGIGTDQFMREEEARARQVARMQQKEKVVKSGTEEAPKMSWLSEVNNALNDTIYNKNVTTSQLLDQNYLSNADDPAIKNYLGGPSSKWDMAFKNTSTKSGAAFDAIFTAFGNKYFRPASAMKLPIADNDKLLSLTGMPTNEDGTVNYKLSTDLYNANGAKFEATDVDDYMMSSGGMELEGKAKVLGAFLGFKTEDNKILMNVVDKKGKVKADEDNENRKAYGSGADESAPNHAIFVALQGDEGVFYKEVDIQTVPGQNQLSELLGPSDDITDTLDTRRRSRSYSAEAEAVIAKNRHLVQENYNKASSNNGAFGTPNFINEAEAFTAPDTGANRNNMIKAYYMTLDSFMNDMNPFDSERLKASTLTDRNIFTQRLSMDSGNSLENEMLNYKVGDMAFIKMYTDTYNNDPDLNAEQKERNNAFGKMWTEYYKSIQSNTK